MKKYNPDYEEYTTAKLSTSSIKVKQSSGGKPSLYIEVDGTRLSTISGKSVEDYLREKGLIEPVDKKTEKVPLTDEEQEAIRSKTVRFF